MALKQKSEKAATGSGESKPTLKKGKKPAKVTEKAAEIEVEVEEKKLPTVEDSPELKKIAEASQEAEKKEEKKKKKAASEAESEAEKKKLFLSISNQVFLKTVNLVPGYAISVTRLASRYLSIYRGCQ